MNRTGRGKAGMDWLYCFARILFCKIMKKLAL